MVDSFQSCTGRKASKAVVDSTYRYQLLLAQLEEMIDPNEPDVKISSPVLPVISNVSNQMHRSHVKIANNLEYRVAVQKGKQIDPRANQETNVRGFLWKRRQ